MVLLVELVFTGTESQDECEFNYFKVLSVEVLFVKAIQSKFKLFSIKSHAVIVYTSYI